MTEPSPQLETLLDRWEASRAAGREITPETLCEDHPKLLDEVRQQIASLRKADELLGAQETAAETLGAEEAHTARFAEGPGSMIGRYKLLQGIGAGGMGEVFLAQQTEPVKRRVALKVIKLGMDTRAVIARFEAERQALAMMDHPNIATVLDAGTTEHGRPYFVMELVTGVPITEYCDRKRLDLRQRLQLIIPVCLAVQHAHQKGIIHRDLKPSNVLVTEHDGVPVPKVIDFGIAKATEQALTEKTLFTEFGRMIGTPEYMSPEQAAMTDLDIDTRSDVYSLGVILYELLTGSTPFESKRLRRLGYAEMQRVIAEEEPHRPSLRLSTLRDRLAELAAERGVSPRRLDLLVRGDLDWMVMKALDKDRKRRYDSAAGFAEDIERYLRSEPVKASPPSRFYVAAKFIRRNRIAVIITAAAVAAVTLGTTVYIVSMQRQQAKTQAALVESRRQESIAKEQGRIAQTERAMAVRTVADVTYALQRTLTKVQASPDVREAINDAITQPLERLHEAYAGGEVSGVEAIDRAIATQLLHAGSIARDRGEYELAITLTAEALVRFEKLATLPQSPGRPSRDPFVSLLRLVDLQLRVGRPAEAAQRLAEAGVHLRTFNPAAPPDRFAIEVLTARVARALGDAAGAEAARLRAEALLPELNNATVEDSLLTEPPEEVLRVLSIPPKPDERP